jgi:heme oxygenase
MAHSSSTLLPTLTGPAVLTGAVLSAVPAAVPAADLRALLKQRTASAHEALERLPLMRALAEGRLDNDEYHDYLLRQHRLQSSLEAALRPWMSSDWPGCRLVKAEWLNDDLRALGSPGRVAGASRVPAPQVASYPQALGVLYVLEGSTLGLQVVRKRLPADHLAQTVAGRFLLGYGQETGARWRSFLDELAVLPCADWPAAAAGAIATFATFQQCFSDDRHG